MLIVDPHHWLDRSDVKAMWQGKRDARGVRASRLFDLTPLGHPVWWAALGTLVVNDNLLKGGGVAPGWLTGKLSDFAFLVVAPVLLTTLLPLRIAWRRALAFALVVGVYVAADLSTTASDAIVALAARLGLRWRLWPDLTDLVALVVLPGSWWIAGRGRRCVLSARRFLETAGVFLGAAACLATSDDSIHRAPFVVNQTERDQTVTLTWLLRKAPCDADLAVLASGLSADDLATPHTEVLSRGQVAPLDYAAAAGTTVAGQCRVLWQSYGDSTQNCSTVIVSAAGGPDVLVSGPRWWLEAGSGGGTPLSCSDPEPKPVCAPTMAIDKSAGPGALSLRMENGALAFKANEKLKMVVTNLADILARPGDGTGCKSRRDRIYALVEGARSCVADGDCRAVQASIDIAGETLCNVYVNRTLSAATLAEERAAWNSQCQNRTGFSCGGGLAQPPVCRGGRCEEACPGEGLPSCTPACADYNLGASRECPGYESLVCYTADLQRCVCGGAPAVLSCQPPLPFSTTCPLGCTTYRAESLPTITPDAGAAAVDSGPVDLRREDAAGFDSAASDR